MSPQQHHVVPSLYPLRRMAFLTSECMQLCPSVVVSLSLLLPLRHQNEQRTVNERHSNERARPYFASEMSPPPPLPPSRRPSETHLLYMRNCPSFRVVSSITHFLKSRRWDGWKPSPAFESSVEKECLRQPSRETEPEGTYREKVRRGFEQMKKRLNVEKLSWKIAPSHASTVPLQKLPYLPPHSKIQQSYFIAAMDIFFVQTTNPKCVEKVFQTYRGIRNSTLTFSELWFRSRVIPPFPWELSCRYIWLQRVDLDVPYSRLGRPEEIRDEGTWNWIQLSFCKGHS